MEHPELKTLILVAGDGDFLDVVKLMKNTLKVRVVIFSWSNSFNYEISKEADESYFFDDLFLKISSAGVPNNGELLMQHPQFKDNIEEVFAAVQRFPKDDEY